MNAAPKAVYRWSGIVFLYIYFFSPLTVDIIPLINFNFLLSPMKTSILLMCCLVVSTITFAQFGSQQIISNNGGECKFCGGDIDGDGDIDIVVTVIPNGVEWFKNTDGLGNFILGQNISTDHDVIRAAFLSDIDGDNDLDVFVASQNDGKIVWYENTDGLGTFGPQQ